MAVSSAKKTWVGITVGVTEVSQNLYDLMAAIDPDVPGYARQWSVQNEPSNSPSGSYTGDIYVGDREVLVSPQRCAVKLTIAGAQVFAGSIIGVPLKEVWVVTDDTDTAMSLNVGVSI